MRRYLIYLAFVTYALSIKAQDTIIMRDATRIEVKVVEITSTEIVYKKWNYQDGPSIRVDFNKIYNVLYANGDKWHSELSYWPNYIYDIDGNSYPAVQIGKQIWMGSNLRAKHFSDGSELPINKKHSSVTEPRCYDILSDDKNSKDIGNMNNEEIGLYYNFVATIDERGLCPEGWHVPSDAEWETLVRYLKDTPELQLGGSEAKALASIEGWVPDIDNGTVGNNPSFNNAVFFRAFPTGSINHNKLINVGQKACYWSSTQVNDMSNNQMSDARILEHDEGKVELCRRFRDYGFSVRCIKDN